MDQNQKTPDPKELKWPLLLTERTFIVHSLGLGKQHHQLLTLDRRMKKGNAPGCFFVIVVYAHGLGASNIIPFFINSSLQLLFTSFLGDLCLWPWHGSMIHE